MKRYGFLPVILVMSIISTGLSGMEETENELKTVPAVDLDRYLGKWYEIAKYPVRFERGLVAVTAEYSKDSKGRIRILNSGRYKSFNGKLKTAKGFAKVPDLAVPSKLKVSFFWPFYGNYWIIELDAEYRWAVVGDPSRKYLWILAREPILDESIYRMLVEKIEAHGYDPSKLEKTPHQ